VKFEKPVDPPLFGPERALADQVLSFLQERGEAGATMREIADAMPAQPGYYREGTYHVYDPQIARRGRNYSYHLWRPLRALGVDGKVERWKDGRKWRWRATVERIDLSGFGEVSADA